jgi:pyruvate formate lyase activating enzyme
MSPCGGVEMGDTKIMSKHYGVPLREALLWEPTEGERVQCYLCPHRCRIADGQLGICGVREAQGGKLYTAVYALVVAGHVDPIEKKPLFHFYPGSTAMSVATPGCNFRCRWCQNYSISQMTKGDGRFLEGSNLPPEDLVALAQQRGCRSISYTYTEPTIFMEYALDSARLAHEKGIANNFVSNGFMTAEALRLIEPYLDAINVDLKSFSEDTYRRLIGGRLEPVLETLRLIRQSRIWLEVTTLVIPDLNDSDEELTKIATFIANLGPHIPWHISRYHPDYQYDSAPPTPRSTLARARRIGLDAGLRYVYTGNLPGDEGESTYCYGCGKVLIQRVGFQILANRLREGRCPDCQARIDGVGL